MLCAPSLGQNQLSEAAGSSPALLLPWQPASLKQTMLRGVLEQLLPLVSTSAISVYHLGEWAAKSYISSLNGPSAEYRDGKCNRTQALALRSGADS